MTAPSNTVIQVNVKTPAGSLLNIYAESIPEAKELVEAFQEELVSSIAALEQAVGAAGAVAASLPLAPQQPSAPVAAAPAAAPAAGGPMCDHGQPAKLVPAGVSKASGKPYPAFYACAMDRANQCNFKAQA